MRTISFDIIIKKSIDRAVLILFKPFSFKKWLCLLFIAVLAGAVSLGNGGGGTGGSSRSSKKAEAAPSEYIVGQAAEEVLQDSEAVVSVEADQSAVEDERASDDKPGWNIPFELNALTITLISIGAVLLVVLMILATWLRARFAFVWFDSVVANDASIREPFHRYRGQGNSFFKLLLVLSCIGLLFIGVIAAWVYSAGVAAGVFGGSAAWSFGKVMTIFVLPSFVFIFGIVFFMLFGVAIEHFVVPIMGIDHCLFTEAWRKFARIGKQNWKDLLLYLLLLIGLGILCGIAVAIIGFICILVALLVGAIILGIPFLLLVTLLKAQVVFIVYAIIIGVPFLIAAFLLLMSASLPFAVFFRCFSLYYLSSLDCGYVPLALEITDSGDSAIKE
ncbi:hypothetical protein ACFL38_04465 [Candidatus Omnitrophota bacterium]